MALYCTYVQNGVYNAPDDRFAQGAVFARDTAGNIRKGIIAFGANDGAVTVVAGTLSVTVQPFTAVIPDAGGRGAYVGGVDSATVVDALAPETTNNRIDVLCFRHLEGQSTDSRGVSTLGPVTLAGQDTAITKQVVPGELYWVKGTPSASSSPSVPAVPANSVPLSRVYVAGGATSLSGANLTDARVFTGTHGARVTWPGVSASTSVGDWPLGTQFAHPSNGRLYVMTSGGLQREYPRYSGTVNASLYVATKHSVQNATWSTDAYGLLWGVAGVENLTAPRAGLMVIELTAVAYAPGNAAGGIELRTTGPGGNVNRAMTIHTNSVAMAIPVTVTVKRWVEEGDVINWQVYASRQSAGNGITNKWLKMDAWME